MNEMLPKIIEYMMKMGYRVDRGRDEINIVYIEGCNDDGAPNDDALDGWNDRRILFDFHQGDPRLLLNVVATTEPGRLATFSAVARRRGGVARIAFGQYTAWRLRYHKTRLHPALVQVTPLPVYRDTNRDGQRVGDQVHRGMWGINQHSTRADYDGQRVANWSEGCLVGKYWGEHMEFIRILRTDARYVLTNRHVFTTTIIPVSALWP